MLPAYAGALLMRGVEHEWHGKSDLYCQASVAGQGEMAVSGARPLSTVDDSSRTRQLDLSTPAPIPAGF
jgi:hypothetical protein